MPSSPMQTLVVAKKAPGDGSEWQANQDHSSPRDKLENPAAELLTIEEEGLSGTRKPTRRASDYRSSNTSNKCSLKFNNWEGAGSSFRSCASSFKSVGDSSVYEYLDEEEVENGLTKEEPPNALIETKRTAPRRGLAKDNSFRRSLQKTLLDDSGRSAFTSSFVGKMSGNMADILDYHSDEDSVGHGDLDRGCNANSKNSEKGRIKIR